MPNAKPDDEDDKRVVCPKEKGGEVPSAGREERKKDVQRLLTEFDTGKLAVPHFLGEMLPSNLVLQVHTHATTKKREPVFVTLFSE